MAKINTTAADAATDEVTGSAETPAPEPIVKSGFKKVKVKDFRGSYGTAKFDDDGVAEVDEATLAQLKAQFPGAEITELD